MEIIKTFPENMTRFQLHQLCNNPESFKMESLEGVNSVEEYALVKAPDMRTGELIQKIFFRCGGQVYGSISESFIRTFCEFVDAMGDVAVVDTFHVIRKDTKNGRTCILFCADSVKEV